MTSPKNRSDDTFNQSARPLARVGFDLTQIFLEAFPLFFPTTVKPSTSSKFFRSYPTLSGSPQ